MPFIVNQNTRCIPSLKPNKNQSLKTAVETVQTSLDTFRPDEQAICNILAHSTSQFREQIKTEFERTHRKELVSELKFKFSDQSRYLMYCLLYTGPDLDAFILNKAMDFGVKEELLIHILATRSYEQISAICASYQKLFKEDLKRRIEMKTMSTFGKLLTFLMNNSRDSGGPNHGEIDKQIEEINKGSFTKISASDGLIPILGKSSFPHVQALATQFEKKKGETLAKHFGEYRGEYEATLKTICEFIVDSNGYFADFLKKSIETANIEQIIIVASTRCEIDLGSISNVYAAKYGRHPSHDISNELGSKYPEIVDGILMLMGIK